MMAIPSRTSTDAASRVLPADLERWRVEIEKQARSYGLDFFDVIFEILDWKQMNEVASYGGFPNRYPHWRFGMEYEHLSKSYAYGLSRIYEMVINNNPCYAYLLYSNKLVDQKMVMAHVYAHCDFFKNNIFFEPTNRHMIDEMANHKTRISRLINKHGFEKVESFLDVCLSIENLIDYYGPHVKKQSERKPSALEEDDEEEESEAVTVRRMRVDRDYLDRYINPKDFLESEKKKLEDKKKEKQKFPEEPVKDVLSFLIETAPLEKWQREILSIVREEAYYFAPQAQTKIMNEGWACVTGDTLIFTDRGLLPMKEIVNGRLSSFVHDGQGRRRITDHAHFPDRKTLRLETRRGFELEGSVTHQILLSDGESWKRLDEVRRGDEICIGGGGGLWPEKEVSIHWNIEKRITLEDVAREAGVSLSTVIRHREGLFSSLSALVIDEASRDYDRQLKTLSFNQNKRREIRVPPLVDESFAAFLGYVIGDGHVSVVKREVGLTSGDESQATHFASLSAELFGLSPTIRRDENRFRVQMSSQHLNDFLQSLGLTTGPSARQKTVPASILSSPKHVVASFLRALFDCDGYAGPSGVILSTSSREMSRTVQLLLLNFGILSTRKAQPKDIWQVQIFGLSAKRFMEEVGFRLERKQQRLRTYVEERRWFKEESWTDEIVSVRDGRAPVYDITVETTHRYSAHGFVNHNSFWHSKIMTEKILEDSEVIDFADHHSGTVSTGPGRLNPYKVGIELFRDVEDRWNRGKFGKEYDECDDIVEKGRWNRNLGLGRKKIFEVRRIYNDVTFLDTFLTPEFCMRHKLFAFDFNRQTDRYEISSREFKTIKDKLLFGLTNFGNPFITVNDANYGNRSELLLTHHHYGVDLRVDYAKEVLKNLFQIWRRPVLVETRVDDRLKLFCFDGKEHKESDTKEGA